MKMGLSYVDICREYDKKLKTKGAKMNRNKRWKPARGRFYYYVTSGGNISRGIADRCSAFQFEYAQGNCFATEEEAKKHLENLKTKGELRLLAEELNGGIAIDWSDKNQVKFAIAYSMLGCGEFLSVSATYAREIGQIYCLSGNFLKKAEMRIGEERLINMIKSGV